jgi:hypothetical protein
MDVSEKTTASTFSIRPAGRVARCLLGLVLASEDGDRRDRSSEDNKNVPLPKIITLLYREPTAAQQRTTKTAHVIKGKVSFTLVPSSYL